MTGVFAVYGRKMLALTLIFNALLTMSYAIGLLAGMYINNWHLYAPFLLDGNLIWLAIIAAVVNIFPSSVVGKVHTGRLWFHHYVYGFFIWFVSAALVMLFGGVFIIYLFVMNTTDVALNVGRFFILGGMVLVLDDLPDVHRLSASTLGWMKSKAYNRRKLLHVFQYLMASITLYFSLAVIASMMVKTSATTLANIILAGTLIVTSLTSFMSAKRGVWLNLSLDEVLKKGH